MSSEIAALEADVEDYRQQLLTVEASLQNDPTHSEIQALKAELEDAITVTQSAIRDLRPTESEEQEHISIPANRKTEEESVVYKVNDTVLARWVSGDKGFYPARVTSITGSTQNPIYNVTFKSYGNSETLRAADLRVLSNERKRKADESAPLATAITASATGPLHTENRREPSKATDGPDRPPKLPRQVKKKQELEAGKSKWQDFANKSKFSKVTKKDSMFRTGEGINARGMSTLAPQLIKVGFTGSGQAMRKDPARSKHIYQEGDDD